MRRRFSAVLGQQGSTHIISLTVRIKRGADGRMDGAERIGGADMGIKHGYGDKTRIWG